MIYEKLTTYGQVADPPQSRTALTYRGEESTSEKETHFNVASVPLLSVGIPQPLYNELTRNISFTMPLKIISSADSMIPGQDSLITFPLTKLRRIEINIQPSHALSV